MPMNPYASDLHIDRLLTNVSVAYFLDPNDFIADTMFPGVPSGPRSNLYRKYSKSDWRRTDAEKRAPGTESAGISWNVNNDRYFAEVYAAHVDIDDQTRANASEDQWNLDSDATRLITNHLLIQKDVLWANQYFKTGVWGTEYTGVASAPTAGQFLQWNQTGSDPLSNFSTWRTAFRLSTVKPVTRMLIGADVWVALENHPAILDRIKFTQRGQITTDLVASFFGVPQVKVAYSSVGAGPKIADAKAQDAATTYAWTMNSKAIMFGYSPDRPSQFEPAMGYTFNWKGYGAGNKSGLTMSQFRQQHLKSDRIEGEAAYDLKLVSADCGVFVNSVVS